MKSIILEEKVVTIIEEHGSTDFPNECCGFLFGHDKGNKRMITEAQPVINVKEGDQRRRFEIAPQDYIKAEMYALQNNIQLLGVYHSHPQHPAIPSEHDLNVALPFFSYIIISIMDGQPNHIRSWQLNDSGQFEEEDINRNIFSLN